MLEFAKKFLEIFINSINFKQIYEILHILQFCQNDRVVEKWGFESKRENFFKKFEKI